MDTQTQTIELKAVQPPKPRQPAPSRPQVAVRPLATTTANVAALVGEGVWAVAGPVGLIAAAGAAVAVPAAGVAMSRVRAKRAQARSLRTTSTTTRGGGLGLPKLPGGRSGLGSSSGRGASTGRSAAGTGTGRSGRSLRSLLGGKPGTGSGSGATGRSGAGTPGSSRAGRSTGSGSKPSAMRRMLDKLRGRGTSGPGGGGSTTSGGKSGKPMSARQARKVAKDLTKQLAAAQKPGRLARLLAWRKKRRAARKKAKAAKTAGKNGTPTQGRGKPAGKVATQVRKPTATQAKTAAKAAAPKANPAPPVQRPNQPSSTTTPTGVTMTASAMRAMLDIVEDMKKVANAYSPEGIEEVMAEYALWPEVLREIASVWKIMAAKAQDEYPLRPAAADLVDAINTHQRAVANAAEQVAPTVRALHRDQFDALDDPTQAMWDHRANGRAPKAA